MKVIFFSITILITIYTLSSTAIAQLNAIPEQVVIQVQQIQNGKLLSNAGIFNINSKTIEQKLKLLTGKTTRILYINMGKQKVIIDAKQGNSIPFPTKQLEQQKDHRDITFK